jgi:hypothetical protein
MSYRVTWTDQAKHGLAGMSPAGAAAVTRAVDSALGSDPYGCGSAPVGRDPDRREASISTVIVRYEISGSVLTVTVLRAVAW